MRRSAAKVAGGAARVAGRARIRKNRNKFPCGLFCGQTTAGGLAWMMYGVGPTNLRPYPIIFHVPARLPADRRRRVNDLHRPYSGLRSKEVVAMSTSIRKQPDDRPIELGTEVNWAPIYAAIGVAVGACVAVFGLSLLSPVHPAPATARRCPSQDLNRASACRPVQRRLPLSFRKPSRNRGRCRRHSATPPSRQWSRCMRRLPRLPRAQPRLGEA